MRIIVVGAGAAGLMAAATAARNGAHVTLLEKNRKTGVKILMSGGTRCNVTQDTDARGITSHFGHARRFLQPSVGAFPPAEVVRMFHRFGVITKVESTGKVFPESDRAVHVRDALHGAAVDAGVTIVTGVAVRGLVRRSGGRPGEEGWTVRTEDGDVDADRLIVTVGGQSWPGCGTTGDGYAWMRELGHTLVPPRPALVPLVGGPPWLNDLSGITIEDCVASVWVRGAKRKEIAATRRSSCLLTHFGLSGPAAMDVSGTITASPPGRTRLELDWIPGTDEHDLEAILRPNGGRGGKTRVSTIVGDFLPARLAAALVNQAQADFAMAELPAKRRRQLIAGIKRLEIPITGTKGFAKAEVTAGGVRLDEIDSRTMASRVAEGLFVAGEILDVDGPIGGYNFQAAFATGRAAAIAATRRG